jgi:PhzF family phenazine biosynthesis protein
MSFQSQVCWQSIGSFFKCGAPENQMQEIAAEINFAESTFITKMNPDEATAEIRIFTPVKEMQFAGHPIIGTSWVLMNKIFNNNLKKYCNGSYWPIQFTNQKV